MKYTVKVKKLNQDAILPNIAKLGDAGADIYAIADTTIKPNETLVVKTGIAIELPQGTEAQIRPTSGNALKTGTILPNSPGTIDEGYRGEVGVIMRNLGDKDITILKGKKIAQMCVREVPTVTFIEVDELSDSERGATGYGSTGVMNK